MWGPGPRSRSRLDPTQPGRANLRPASALGAAITLTVAVPIILGSPSQVPFHSRSGEVEIL